MTGLDERTVGRIEYYTFQEVLCTHTGYPNYTHYICIVFFTVLMIILITYSIFFMTYLLLLLTYLFFYLYPIIALIVFYILYFIHLKMYFMYTYRLFVRNKHFISALPVHDTSLINLYFQSDYKYDIAAVSMVSF